MEHSPTKKSFRHYMYFLFGQNFSMLGSFIVEENVNGLQVVETLE